MTSTNAQEGLLDANFEDFAISLVVSNIHYLFPTTVKGEMRVAKFSDNFLSEDPLLKTCGLHLPTPLYFKSTVPSLTVITETGPVNSGHCCSSATQARQTHVDPTKPIQPQLPSSPSHVNHDIQDRFMMHLQQTLCEECSRIELHPPEKNCTVLRRYSSLEELASLAEAGCAFCLLVFTAHNCGGHGSHEKLKAIEINFGRLPRCETEAYMFSTCRTTNSRANNPVGEVFTYPSR
jgi:hypothetical protein